jgi:acyl carrier protein
MSIESELQRFIFEEVTLDKDTEVALDEQIVESGRVDSLGLIQVLGFIQQHYHVDLLSVGTPKDFATVSSMAALIRRIRNDDIGVQEVDST